MLVLFLVCKFYTKRKILSANRNSDYDMHALVFMRKYPDIRSLLWNKPKMKHMDRNVIKQVQQNINGKIQVVSVWY